MASETGFTKGPWDYSGTVEDHRGNPCVTDADNLVVAVALDDGKEAEECEANARLISAAPDLYEALKHARDELGQYEMERSGEQYNSQRINEALSKAEGK